MFHNSDLLKLYFSSLPICLFLTHRHASFLHIMHLPLHPCNLFPITPQARPAHLLDSLSSWFTPSLFSIQNSEISMHFSPFSNSFSYPWCKNKAKPLNLDFSPLSTEWSFRFSMGLFCSSKSKTWISKVHLRYYQERSFGLSSKTSLPAPNITFLWNWLMWFHKRISHVPRHLSRLRFMQHISAWPYSANFFLFWGSIWDSKGSILLSESQTSLLLEEGPKEK